LIGRIQSEHLASIETQIAGGSAIDLAEVTMVDLEAVRFLSRKESEGCDLLNCAPFIREWIQRERGENFA
jgi:hypothetical protein